MVWKLSVSLLLIGLACDAHVQVDVPSNQQPTCRCGWTNKKEASRIVDDQQILSNEYPFPALIYNEDRRTRFCGASIISPYHVLTAAHCTFPKKGQKLVVAVGLHDVTKRNLNSKMIDVAYWVEHPNYSSTSHVNDIAIMVLKEKIEFNDHVGPVCLPNKKIELLNEVIKVMGWGRTFDAPLAGRSSQTLNLGNLRVVPLDICKWLNRYFTTAIITQVCTHTYHKDSCTGDSGGPLVWLDPETNRYVQVALVSIGRACSSTDPGVNTEIWHYMDWIRSTVQKTKPTPLCSYPRTKLCDTR